MIHCRRMAHARRPGEHATTRMIAGRVSLLMTSALLIGASTTASARDYAPRTVGSWTVAASKDGTGCFLTREYDRSGKTTLLLGLDIDGNNHLSVLNENWSIKPRDRQELTFRLSKGGYDKHAVVGMASDGKRGFVTNFDAKFPTYFAGSRALHIARGDVPVEQLPLDGSGAAVAALRACVDLHRARSAPAASEKAHSDGIPKDPFAPESKRRPKK